MLIIFVLCRAALRRRIMLSAKSYEIPPPKIPLCSIKKDSAKPLYLALEDFIGILEPGKKDSS
jgi:hypothetical protein